MAPEAPGNLVVIDLYFEDGELRGYVEKVEYSPEDKARIEKAIAEAGGWFAAIWSETPGTEDYVSLGGGVVYVRRDLPPGYRISRRNPIEPTSLGNDRFSCTYPALGEGLMLVLILPEGYTLADSGPKPRRAKIFKKRRLAVYWKPEEKNGEQATVVWELGSFTGDLRAERDRINADIHKADNVPDNPGVSVDVPTSEVMAPANSPVEEPAPENLQSALLQLLWPQKRWIRILVLLIVVLLAASFAIWGTLPDDVKSRLIDVLFSP